MLQHHITDNKHKLSVNAIAPKAAIQKGDHRFLQINPDANVLPFWVGGFFLFLLVFYLFIYFDRPTNAEPLSTFEIILGVFSLLGFLFLYSIFSQSQQMDLQQKTGQLVE